ncbi:MAG: hypothetical protein VYD57_17390 [Pseudomonadota bacterium]|nr:hypothetical protein [Pseudomonadota bacterium]
MFQRGVDEDEMAWSATKFHLSQIISSLRRTDRDGQHGGSIEAITWQPFRAASGDPENEKRPALFRKAGRWMVVMSGNERLFQRCKSSGPFGK